MHGHLGNTFKATCRSVIDKVRKDRFRVTITRHGKSAAELIPISTNLESPVYLAPLTAEISTASCQMHDFQGDHSGSSSDYVG